MQYLINVKTLFYRVIGKTIQYRQIHKTVTCATRDKYPTIPMSDCTLETAIRKKRRHMKT